MLGDGTPHRLIALVLVVVLAGAAPHARPQQATFSAGNRTVAVFATVTDATGRLVPYLTRSVTAAGVAEPGLTARARRSYLAATPRS